jgi:hypothetical protein
MNNTLELRKNAKGLSNYSMNVITLMISIAKSLLEHLKSTIIIHIIYILVFSPIVINEIIISDVIIRVYNKNPALYIAVIIISL